jgi:hypothetical protein
LNTGRNLPDIAADLSNFSQCLFVAR